MKPVNDFLDTEDTIPEEVPSLPGFFFYPDDKRIAVSCIGQVINLKTGKQLKGSPARNGNLYIHVTEPGPVSGTKPIYLKESVIQL